MLPIFLASIVIILSCIALMSVGYFLHKKPIAGSCGGLASYQARQGKPSLCGQCGREITEPCDDAQEGSS